MTASTTECDVDDVTLELIHGLASIACSESKPVVAHVGVHKVNLTDIRLDESPVGKLVLKWATSGWKGLVCGMRARPHPKGVLLIAPGELSVIVHT